MNLIFFFRREPL